MPVAEQHDAFVGELHTHMFMDDVCVVDQKVPAAPIGEKYCFRLRSTMTAVIMGTNDNPALVRRVREALIAIDVFAHSMEQLDDA
jgi:hypothetical protein